VHDGRSDCFDLWSWFTNNCLVDRVRQRPGRLTSFTVLSDGHDVIFKQLIDHAFRFSTKLVRIRALQFSQHSLVNLSPKFWCSFGCNTRSLKAGRLAGGHIFRVLQSQNQASTRFWRTGLRLLFRLAKVVWLLSRLSQRRRLHSRAESFLRTTKHLVPTM
jgi:hypothetical protein